MLYQAYQTQSDLLSPLRLLAQHTGAALWLHNTERSVLRRLSAACEVVQRLKLTHSRPLDERLSGSASLSLRQTRALLRERLDTGRSLAGELIAERRSEV